MHRPPLFPVFDHKGGENQMLRLHFKFRARENFNVTAAARRPAAFLDDPSFQIAKTFVAKAEPDFFKQIASASLKAIDVALIEPAVAGLVAIRLAQDAADKLSQRCFRTGIG